MKFTKHSLIAAGLVAMLGFSASTTVFAATPPDYDKLVTEAQSLKLDGEDLASFIDYYQASLVKPAGKEATDALNTLLHDGLPKRIPQFVFDATRTSANPLKLTLCQGGQVLEVSPSAGEVPEIDDPQNKWPFTRLTYFYRQSAKPAGDWDCYAIVHSQTAEDEQLGEHMGRLLCVLRSALVEKTTYVPLTDGKPFGVWLTRHTTTAAGGQEWENNIYFYDVTVKRSQIEWIREIAHEFSHLALPAIGGDYSDPEPWANGYYGEQLLLRWLHEGAAGGPTAVSDAWGGPFSGYVNFEKLLITPYLADFNSTGMNANRLNKHDGGGMRYLIGMLLEVDDHAGPKVLGDMLWSLPQGALVDPSLLYTPAADAMSRPAIPAVVAPQSSEPAPATLKPAVIIKPVQPAPPPAKTVKAAVTPKAVVKLAPKPPVKPTTAPKPPNPPVPASPPVMAH